MPNKQINLPQPHFFPWLLYGHLSQLPDSNADFNASDKKRKGSSNPKEKKMPQVCKRKPALSWKLINFVGDFRRFGDGNRNDGFLQLRRPGPGSNPLSHRKAHHYLRPQLSAKKRAKSWVQVEGSSIDRKGEGFYPPL